LLSRRAVLVAGAAALASVLPACAPSKPSSTAQSAMPPSYAGMGGTNAFDGIWTAASPSGYWRIETKDGVFSGTVEAKFGSGRGQLAGYLRKNLSIEGTLWPDGDPQSLLGLSGTWPVMAVHWPGGVEDVRF
jgi:hypothetical protein